jgi:TRAP-type transport system periplasmic protein
MFSRLRKQQRRLPACKNFSILLFVLIPAITATAQPPLLCRISVENPASHFHARAVRQFADLLAERSKGALRVEFHDGASLYRDADAVGALATGNVEIIVPGIWQLDRFVPETAALMMPTTYGQSRQTMRTLVDGPFGDRLSASIGKVLGAVVVGPWLDVGYGQMFSATKPIRTTGELAARRIRVAGGKANEERIRALGGTAVAISMADLPSYLERGLLDGVLSTYETIDTAKLDGQGIKWVLEDFEYYPFYVPLAGARFWASLSPELKALVVRTWNEVLEPARAQSILAQATAKKNLQTRGLVVFQPTDQEQTATRKKLLENEDAMALRLNIPAEIMQLLRLEMARQPKE